MDTKAELNAAYESALAEQRAAKNAWHIASNRRRLSSARDVDTAWKAARQRLDAADAALKAAYDAVEAVDPTADEDDDWEDED